MSQLRKMLTVTCLWAIAFGGLGLSGASLRVTAVDESGGAFPDVLIIVKSLEGEGEAFRALTNTQGQTATDVSPGLYRVIATCPYGVCKTVLSEHFVKDGEADIELVVPFEWGPGNVVTVGSEELMAIRIIDQLGQAIGDARVLVRDEYATDEQWYRTDSNGEVKARIPSADVITVVVSHDEILTTRELDKNWLEKLRVDGQDLVLRVP